MLSRAENSTWAIYCIPSASVVHEHEISVLVPLKRPQIKVLVLRMLHGHPPGVYGQCEQVLVRNCGVKLIILLQK